MHGHNVITAPGASAEGLPEGIVEVGVKVVADCHLVSAVRDDEAVLDVGRPRHAAHLFVARTFRRHTARRPNEATGAGPVDRWLDAADLDVGHGGRCRAGWDGDLERVRGWGVGPAKDVKLMAVKGGDRAALNAHPLAGGVAVGVDVDRCRGGRDRDAAGVGQLLVKARSGQRGFPQDVEPVVGLHHRDIVSRVDGLIRRARIAHRVNRVARWRVPPEVGTARSTHHDILVGVLVILGGEDAGGKDPAAIGSLDYRPFVGEQRPSGVGGRRAGHGVFKAGAAGCRDDKVAVVFAGVRKGRPPDVDLVAVGVAVRGSCGHCGQGAAEGD